MIKVVFSEFDFDTFNRIPLITREYPNFSTAHDAVEKMFEDHAHLEREGHRYHAEFIMNYSE